ncbi:SixA phosphatase family protein [Pseudoprimorskyibacter insulae]|uniref:2,3-bisphosphoglycerate-dependent phosphoglycerate mutase n=1 Tax=Pseudoprimorskyibacter insulae TaxID=1695997 RepID=A0A2R8AP30_9RHOB|nr:histidine phosphatase family protein [Pseudoprimorskyibacter insulae]SPF77793.1 2,3-bisphosphoglycerate-dependent phosphoglycerate mutase [Pseudoprimorskyibacter insulae]
MRLIAMRHAKSDWSAETGSDHARPLNDRGVKSAKAMGDWLRAHGYLPDLVLCSTATRTRQTLDFLALEAPVQFEDSLYHASACTMLDSVEGATGDTVLLIGHNPGMAEFARKMVRTPPAHPRFHDYPTCATLVMEITAPDWASVDFGMGEVLDFAIPREVIAQTEKAG